MTTKTITTTVPLALPPGLNEPKVTSKLLKPDGNFPNNATLPLLIYRGAFDLVQDDPASQIEDMFETNLWGGTWRNGIYPYHHYHSTSHEVLACYSGDARVQLGGPNGIVAKLECGDVVIIPAGVAHKNLDCSANFRIVGAYPRGQHNYDLRRGLPGERPRVDEHIARVPLPDTDPVYGASGPLVREWNLLAKSRKVPTSIRELSNDNPLKMSHASPGKFSVRENQ
jgi:uncharacterized protein YjlB